MFFLFKLKIIDHYIYIELIVIQAEKPCSRPRKERVNELSWHGAKSWRNDPLVCRNKRNSFCTWPVPMTEGFTILSEGVLQVLLLIQFPCAPNRPFRWCF